jgi:hypothetical protein
LRTSRRARSSGPAVGGDRVGADRAQERVVLALLAAEIRARLIAQAELPADPAQIGLDEGAVAEHQVEEARVAERLHDLLHRMTEAIERIDPALDQEDVGEPRRRVDNQDSDDERDEGDGERRAQRPSAAA